MVVKCPIAALLLCRQCRGPELIGRVISVGIISNYNNYHYHRRGDGDRVALPSILLTSAQAISKPEIGGANGLTASSNFRTGDKRLWWYGGAK